MTAFQLTTILMVLVALAGWLNVKTLNLPHGVAMLIAGIAGSVAMFAIGAIWPGFTLVGQLAAIVDRIDFASAVLGYMLAFLLFAGAMQVDLGEMRRRWLSIGALATLGVAASVVIVGAGTWSAAHLLGFHLPLAWALVFGALISPTDPIAVLATVKHGHLSKTLRVILQGEALFNDGVGIVVFTALLAVATGTGDGDAAGAVAAVFVEALGGLALGLAASAAVIWAMSAIDDFVVEVSLSIALAMAVYAGAQALHLSGAIAVVGAGVLFGGGRAREAMRGGTEPYLRAFWTLVDEILNALLFLLLGVELLVVPFLADQIVLIAAIIPLVLAARFVVVLPWGTYFRFRHGEFGAAAILSWGGLHGALSLALALAIPAGPERALILSATYAMVAFSITVQGLSFAKVTKFFEARSAKGP